MKINNIDPFWIVVGCAILVLAVLLVVIYINYGLFGAVAFLGMNGIVFLLIISGIIRLKP